MMLAILAAALAAVAPLDGELPTATYPCQAGEYLSGDGACHVHLPDLFAQLIEVDATHPQLGQAYDALVDFAAEFDLPSVRGIYVIPEKVVNPTLCGSGTDSIWFYCPDDTVIRLGSRRVDSYGARGEAFPYYMLGHEYGHHLQHGWGLGFAEAQADCFGGVFVAYAGFEIDDLASLRAVAGDEQHGTGSDMLAAVASGHEGGFAACWSYEATVAS